MFLQFTIQCESPISMIQENAIENHKTMGVIKATINIFISGILIVRKV
jgi:hypothetical protein